MPFYRANNTMTHFHHIVPVHMGGSDDSSNFVELTIEEHAEAHRKLYEQHGIEEDRIAWLGLAGEIDCGEIQARSIAAAMKRPEVRAAISKTMTGKKKSRKHCTNMSKTMNLPHVRAKIVAALTVKVSCVKCRELCSFMGLHQHLRYRCGKSAK